MAQTSSTNTRYKMSFRKIARAALAELRVHKKLTIITFVLYGVAMLLFIFNSSIGTYSNDYGTPDGMFFYSSGWGTFFAVCGAAVSYFTVLNVFRDMNNQQICDVSMALPIKASERFFSKLLSLVIIQLIPQIVCIFGGNGIKILYGNLIYGFLPSDAGETLLQMSLGFPTGTLFIMAIVILCVCCCGAPAESSYFSIILMGIINVLPLCFINYLISNCAGMPYYFGSIEPIDYGYWGFLFLADFYDKFVLHCVVGCVISIAVILASGLIYMKRDAKTVGNPIASRTFFEIMLVLGCVTVFMFFLMTDGMIWGFLVAAVAYIIINIIVCRAKINALSFVKWGAKYLATAAAFTLAIVIMIETGGFGYIHLRPNAELLDGANFMIGYYDYEYHEPNEYTGNTRNLRADNLTPEQADKVMSICKKYMAEGSAKINPLSKIFRVSFNYDVHTNITVTANSNKTYDERPFPHSQFELNYVLGRGYSLDYRQDVSVPIADAREMAQELLTLDFVYEYVDQTPLTYTYRN